MAEIKAGDIVFYSGTSWISKTIQWFQNSIWSHVDVVTDVHYPYFYTASAEMFGVELKVRKISTNKVRSICRLPEDSYTEPMETGIQYLLDMCQSEVRYDYEGLIGYAFMKIFRWSKNRWQKPDAVFCSEMTDMFLLKIGFKPKVAASPGKVSPKKLWKVLGKYEISL